MNSRLRKRVLGAGVVVALAAMILPFVMQGEGYKANRQLAEDAQTRIPARPPLPANLETAIPVPSEDVRTALLEPESLPEPIPTPTPPAAKKPDASESAKPKPVPPTVPKPAAEVKSKPLDKPVEKPVTPLPATSSPSKPLEAVVPKPVEKPVPPPTTKPAETAASQANAPSTTKEAWLIQLGSFTAESNAQNLLTQVQRVGVSAKVERIDVKGSPVWRVTSGTYATRAEADAALNVLKTRLNLGGMVRPAR